MIYGQGHEEGGRAPLDADGLARLTLLKLGCLRLQFTGVDWREPLAFRQAHDLASGTITVEFTAGDATQLRLRLRFLGPDDLAPLDSKPKVSEEVTDTYLADLAAKHGFKFSTLDGGIKHPAAELIG